MRWPFAAFSALSFVLPLAAEEIRSAAPATKWEEGLPLASSVLGAMDFAGTTSDRLLLFKPLTQPAVPEAVAAMPTGGNPPALVYAAAKKAGAEKLFSWLGGGEISAFATLHLDWLKTEGLTATEFSRVLDPADGIATSHFERDSTGLSRDVFCSESSGLLVIHMRANKPGALNFKIGLEPSASAKADSPQVEDRRILILHGKMTAAADSPEFEVRAWIFPMESEVTPAEKDISVLGEGEALVLVGTAFGPAGSHDFAALKDKLKPFGFGGDEHPDIYQLWEDLRDKHLENQRKLMIDKREDH